MPKLTIRRLNVQTNDEQQMAGVNFRILGEDGKPLNNGTVGINGPLSAGILALAPNPGDYVIEVTPIPPAPAE